jgi:hypothetical protein
MGHPLHFMEGGVGVEGALEAPVFPSLYPWSNRFLQAWTRLCPADRRFWARGHSSCSVRVTGAPVQRTKARPVYHMAVRPSRAQRQGGGDRLERLSKGQRRDPCTTWPSGPPEHRDKEGETGWSACPKDKGATRVPHGRQALPSTETRRGRQAGAPVQRTKARPVYHMAVRPSRAQRQGGGDRHRRCLRPRRPPPRSGGGGPCGNMGRGRGRGRGRVEKRLVR